MRPYRILAAALIVCGLHAMQLQDIELISPVTGERFIAVVPAGNPGAAPTRADMGTDVDGCRHSSGVNEYDYYVVVDPHSYFAALSSEWDQRTGRFQSELPQPVIDWVRKEFEPEREVDVNHAFQYQVQLARGTGQAVPERKGFIIPQNSIPVEKRYRLALSAYERRGARSAVTAKIALTGAWALRARAQMPIAHQSLAGGFEEVNARISRQIKDGEAFEMSKWLDIYKGIFEKDGMTREGYTIAATALFGFALRDGDPVVLRDIVTRSLERLGKDDKPDLMRGVMRDRKRLADDHHRLLGVAAERFIAGLQAEEFVRPRIPEVLLVVGECFRRIGVPERAMDWYLALARLPETQPAAREALRNEGRQRSLPADRPYHVQLGWIADEQRERLAKQGVAHPGEIAGQDRALLTAILNEGLGTATYNAPGWKPRSGGTATDSAIVLDLVGKGVIEHAFRLGGWPKSLGELWETEVVKDRNRVNRFHCPATGKELLYVMPPGDIANIAPSTVLVATSAPVETREGPRYGVFQANARVVWVEQAPTVGQPLTKP
jgi:hypothetical protein